VCVAIRSCAIEGYLETMRERGWPVRGALRCAAFVGGGVWGAYGERRWTTWPLALPIGVLAVAAAIDLAQPVHPRRRPD
jgi:hypothetical protein